MAGLFDSSDKRGFGFGYGNVWAPPGADAQQSGGILGGGAPSWGGIFAALKDAGSYLGGSGSTDNFASFQAQNQQNIIRRQLMAGLTSDDPGTRQQAYAIAPMFGVDPSAFQKQQANAALPGLLGRISQPQSVTMPSATGTLPDGSKLTTAPVTATGGPMSLSDALQSAPPELQSQYAPDIIKQQIEADKPYDLAPGSTRYRGTTPLVTAPLKQNPNEPFNADGSPNVAFQKYDFAKARNAAQVRAEFRAPPKSAAPSGFSSPASLFRNGGR